ncbi:MAG: acyl--CoA ligase [Candidatus Hydrogenedentes bacterium]|nr:acyl--CoA ligase [Candidatus Hydrogenedentota bacterium]
MKSEDRKLLWHSVEYWADVQPNKEAIVFGDIRLTWRQLKQKVDQLAESLIAHGVGKGDKVALLAMACPEFITSFMATSKVGGIWQGISPKFSKDEIYYFLSDSQPRILFALDHYMNVDLLEMILEFKNKFPFLHEVVVIGDPRDSGLPSYNEFLYKTTPNSKNELEKRIREVTEDDEVLLMYTSGSTGKPKGVLHTHRAVMCSAMIENKYMFWSPDARILLHFPINHVAADVEMGYTALYSGATIVLMDRFLPEGSLYEIEKEKITHLGQVPAMYLMQMSTKKFQEMDWSSMKVMVWGAYSASEKMVRVLSDLAKKYNFYLLTGYGSTEVCGFTTYSKPDDSVELLFSSTGRIVPPYEVKVVDENRNEVAIGKIGEIAFRGPVVMKEYLNNPTATSLVKDKDGWFYTSDLGWVDENGYLYVCGRKSEMYKTGGENVFPKEIEDVLEMHPAVQMSAVIGVPDSLYGEIGYAFVVPKLGAQVTESELREYCKRHLAVFKVPRKFEIRKALPLLSNGKVDKLTLRQWVAS